MIEKTDYLGRPYGTGTSIYYEATGRFAARRQPDYLEHRVNCETSGLKERINRNDRKLIRR